MFLLNPGLTVVCGMPASGKSQFVIKLLNNPDMFAHKPKTILFYYEKYQPIYEKLPLNASKIEGVPESIPNLENTVLVFDDLADVMDSNFELFRLATCHARHNLSYVILIRHNLFSKNKFSRDLNLSAQYYALFQNGNISQIATFGRQLFPRKQSYFLDAYKKACSNYGYLFIDLTPFAKHRVLSDIFVQKNPALYVEL